MTTQNYFGLDSEEGNSWTLIQYLEGKVILLQQFGDTVDGLNSLERFIRDGGGRPGICVKLSSDSTFRLLAYLNAIPDAEVIFVL